MLTWTVETGTWMGTAHATYVEAHTAGRAIDAETMTDAELHRYVSAMLHTRDLPDLRTHEYLVVIAHVARVRGES